MNPIRTKRNRVACRALLSAAAALLSTSVVGCAGAGPPPSAVPLVQNSTTRAGANGAPWWMNPQATKSDLLYVSGVFGGDIDVYDYPQGTLVGTLTGLTRPTGMCVDKAGNVWITAVSQIMEYAHGGSSPITTLNDTNEDSNGCSVDQRTGNLAVGNESTTQGGTGSVWIYKNAQGPATQYTVTNMVKDAALTYDDRGNLYVAGFDQYNYADFAELAKGGSAFTKVTLEPTINHPGGIQWDGKYVAIASRSNTDGNGAIDQFAFTGTVGKEVGSTVLTGENAFVNFWRQGGNVVVVDPLSDIVGYYSYAKGGMPTRTLSGPNGSFGVVVSLKK